MLCGFLDWVIGQESVDASTFDGGLGAIPLLGIVETAAGLLGISTAMTLPDNVARVSFGSGDFAADISAEWTADNPALLAARCQLVWASRAHSLPAPVDTAFPWITDHEGLRAEAENARSIGYRGKFCIHPQQLSVVAAALTPTARDVEWARNILTLWESETELGSGALRVDNMLVDEAIVKRARDLIADARKS